MAENVRIILPEPTRVTVLPTPVQQVHIRTGPETILTTPVPDTSNAFGIVNVSGQANVVASTNSDILRVVAGSGISVTTDPPNNSLTIIATGGSAIDQLARDTANSGWGQANTANVTGEAAFAKANTANITGEAAFSKANTANVTGEAAFAKANTANVTGQAAFDKANTAIYTAAQIRANVSNTAPVNYDPSTGIFSHALSGVTATGYGDAATVPKVVVDDKGHITSVTNTAIAVDAAAVSSGILSVARGGTGQNTYANGELLIGNTISGGLDRSNLTQGYGIIITNSAGDITIDAATGRTYYLVLSQASDIATYNVAQVDPSSGPEVNTSIVYTGTAYQLTSVFATPPGDPNTYLLPAGTYGRHIHATTDGLNNEAQLRVDLYKRASNTLETLLRTNESPIFNSGNSSVLLAWNITDAASYGLDVTDRLVWKLYVRRVSGGSGSVRVTLFYEGVDRASYIPSTIAAPAADVVARAVAAAAFIRANTANITAEAAFAKANTANITGQAAFDKANTAIYTAAQIRANISNTAPINYDSTTGIISHATSGVTATGYGDAATLPKVVVDDKGHVTSVTNTAIAISAAAITSGTLAVNRGGTGQSSYANGELLIGNTISGGLDKRTLTQGSGIIITNGNGTITIDATGGAATDQYARDKANGAVQLGYPRINVAANATLIAATTNNDILYLLQGSGITLSPNAAQSSITITASGGSFSGVLNVASGGTGLTPTIVNGALLIGNTVNSGFDLNTLSNSGSGGILITNGQGTITLGANVIWMRGNLSATAPINYTPATGVIAHDTSGVVATGYGTATQIPVFVVNATGHVTSVTNTAIAGLDAGVITTGSLPVPRGGTGLNPSIVNGAILIGNTVNSGFDLNTIANTGSGGILITNGQGTITLGANVIWMRGNLAAVAPITYTASNGTFTHDGSGVSATGYGTASQIPVFAVNETGHVISVTNTAIAGLDAGVITTGRLAVPRGGTGLTPTIVNGAILIGNTVNSGFDLNTIANTGSGGILITNGQGTITLGANVIWVRGNVGAVAPINYTASNGNFTHAGSGVTATGYGTASQIPVFVVNETGHVTSVTNTAIAGLDASVITTGRLAVARGGTGLSPTISNGALLIGNTVNSGFDLNTLANTGSGGILITNGQGTITLGANVIWVRGNVGAVAPINYTASNGNFTHAGSGVTATGYGTASQIPVFVVNETGHVTSVTNTAIAGLDASVITTGRLAVARGGTGISPTIANGALLIGNTVNSGFDLNTLANTGTGGILITNGQGTITLGANVIWMRGNIGAVAPITYTASNGNFTHDGSGVTATGYGTASQIPVFVVNQTGHVTSVTNTAIAGLDASVITTGRLAVARGGTGLTPTISNGALLIGNTVNSGFDLNTLSNTGSGGILITNGQGTITLGANVIWMRGNIGAVAPITYTAANGNFTHDGSGVTATGYGTATQIPVFVVNATGHVTSVTNTAIAGLDAGVITTGRLAVPRGGTGLTPTIVNGAILIGNTVNSGFDLNTIANTGTGGILITNGQGTITLGANVIWVRGNVGAVAPINYTAANGNFTHAGSGVTATGYGTAALIPVFVVNETGHVTSVTNTAIAGLDAGVITTGILPILRGGTGRGLTGVSNGQLLIGNTTNSGFDLATLTQGTNITITNGNGTIRIDAAGGGGNSYGVINIGGTGSANINSGSANDTLKILAGPGIILTTDAAAESLTIEATGGAATDQFARDKANGAVQLGYPRINVAANATLVAATTNNDILFLNKGYGINLTSNAAQSSVTISRLYPYIKSIAVISPNVSDNIAFFYTHMEVTWREVVSVLRGTATPNVVFALTYANTRTPGGTETAITGNITCANTTNGVFTTAFTNATVPANNYVLLRFSTVTGTVDEIDITMMT